MERPDMPPTFRGTVGSYCELTGYYPVQVHGYSLVLGLPQTGSSECPPSIKTFLTKHIRSLRDGGYLPSNFSQLTAEQIINSRNTALVEVIGVVPAGAPKGDQFDVEVTVLEGTQTTSLQGGWLMPTELRQVVGRYTGGTMVRQPTARARGLVFINPLPLSAATGEKADPRRGIVRHRDSRRDSLRPPSRSSCRRGPHTEACWGRNCTMN